MMYLYAILVFILTTCIGSFLNVVIYRLPNKMSLAYPASHCPKCNSKIKWYDNIPILSFILLKGKCRNCKEKISPRYVIVESLTGIVSTLIFIKFGLTLTSLFGILLFLCLIPISFIDIETHEIPDVLQLILLVLGICSVIFNDFNYIDGIIVVDYKSKLIAAGSVLLFSLIMILIQSLFKKELIGGGDLKLLFVLGLNLGWQLLIALILFSSLFASIIELSFSSIKKKKREKLKDKTDLTEIEDDEMKGLFPFGPYLSTFAIILYVFGEELLKFYLNLVIYGV